jgi:HEPN domain-containing protein
MNMEPEEFDVEEVTKFWLLESEEALQVTEHLLEKADYSYALFFGHLAVEKMLKALYAAKLRQHAPPIHNLLRLARALGLDLDEARVEALISITAFNIEARYPDLKRSFRKKCTAEYAQGQMTAVKEIHKWLKLQLR